MKILLTLFVTLLLCTGFSQRSAACVDFHPDSIRVNILADTLNCNLIIEIANLNMFGGNPNDFCSCGITDALGNGNDILWVAFVDAETHEPIQGFDLWGFSNAAGDSWEDADPESIDWNGFVSNVNASGIVTGQDVKLWIIMDITADSEWSWVCGSDESTMMEIFGQFSFGTDEFDNEAQELADTHQDISNFYSAWMYVFFITPEEYQEYIESLENHYNSIYENNPIEFSLYPNPSSSTLFLKTNRPIDHCVIRDIAGRKVLTENGNIKNLEVSHLPNGMYIVHVEISGKLLTQKIQISH
jgi:hypothetical protein